MSNSRHGPCHMVAGCMSPHRRVAGCTSPRRKVPGRTSPRRMVAGCTAMCVTAMFVVASVSGCGSGSGTSSGAARAQSAPASSKDTTIRLQNIAIHPSKVTIQRGSTVTWRWLDGDIDTAHNVTSQPGGLQFKPSGTRLTGSYSIRFDKPGKYFYECTIHPASMQGEIVVE